MSQIQHLEPKARKDEQCSALMLGRTYALQSRVRRMLGGRENASLREAVKQLL